MYVRQLSRDIDATKYLKALSVDGGGTKILSEKMQTLVFYIHDLHVGAANILKQDALSIGADLAVPKGTITCEKKYVDCILTGTRKQIRTLSKKELAQPYGLKEVARTLQLFLGTKEHQSFQIMGVLNANADSFYAQSRFQAGTAMQMLEKMINDGADIIDIGAVSSRPGAEAVNADEELMRLKDIIELIHGEQLHKQVVFSLDSYAPKVAEFALERGFGIINDITGLADDELCRIVAEHDARAVVMHMQGTPQTMQLNPHYDNLFEEMDRFFAERLEKADKFGIKDVVLDVGIGFGKSLEHNLALIQHMAHFKQFHKPLLIGASRKSMINLIDPSEVSQRLPGTLAIHLKAYENGAEIIRTHDVSEHRQALKVHDAILTQ